MKFANQPLLSVIVPIYNVELYLSRCLDSIINQTYQNLEIICVDDGSTDQSGTIADEYAKKDYRIKVIHKENGGVVSARKTGTLLARGKYITNVDSDDYIEINMFDNLMQQLLTYNADVITSGLIRDYGNHLVYEGESIKAGVYEENALRQKVLFNIIDTKYFFKTNISLHITNKIFRTEDLKEFQLKIDDNINVGDDVAVWFPYFINCKKIIVSGKNFYHYCVRNDSIMGKKEKNDLDSLRALFLYLYGEIKKVNYSNNFNTQIFYYKMAAYLIRDASKVLKVRENELYPFGEISRTQTIALYGAGKFGEELKNFLESNGFHVVAWVDKSKNRKGVITLAELSNIKYDVIIIGTLVSVATRQIKEELINNGIKEDIIFSINEKILGT